MRLMKTFQMADMPQDVADLWTDYICDSGCRGYISIWVDIDMRVEWDTRAPSKFVPLADWLIAQGAEENEQILVEFDW